MAITLNLPNPNDPANLDTWGTQLNSELKTKVEATINQNTAAIASITAGTAPDATTGSKGVVQLAGDLTGTAASPALASSGVGAGTYGSATGSARLTIDGKGRVTAAQEIPITVTGTGGTTVTGATRTTFSQPFAATSHWNTAIGSSAVFEAANGPMTTAVRSGSAGINSNNGYGIPINVALPSDPVATVTASPGDSYNPAVTYTHRVPDPARISTGTDQNLCVIDGGTYYDYWLATRNSSTSYSASVGIRADLTGTGRAGGIRAAKFPTIAGLIRTHEIENLSIPHALILALPNTKLKRGWVWPANGEDGDAATAYSGVIPVGTLFAIPSSVDITTLGLSPEGLALARALQDYGAYVGDRAGVNALYADALLEQQYPAAYTRLNDDWGLRIISKLQAVTNQSSTAVGGGGTPRQATQGPVKIDDDRRQTELDRVTVTVRTAVPTTGRWAVGDRVLNSTPTELGAAGSKYLIDGWTCTAAGTPGTWLPRRVLTGN